MTAFENPVAEMSWKRTGSLSLPTKALLVWRAGGGGLNKTKQKKPSPKACIFLHNLT